MSNDDYSTTDSELGIKRRSSNKRSNHMITSSELFDTYDTYLSDELNAFRDFHLDDNKDIDSSRLLVLQEFIQNTSKLILKLFKNSGPRRLPSMILHIDESDNSLNFEWVFREFRIIFFLGDSIKNSFFYFVTKLPSQITIQGNIAFNAPDDSDFLALFSFIKEYT